MSDIGCGDNSCVFKVLRGPGVGTNGGCRCFKNLEAWIQTGNDASEGHWNRDEVHRVERDTRRLAVRVRELLALHDEALALADLVVRAEKSEAERDALRAQVEAARTYARQALDYGEDCDATDLLRAMDEAKP